MRGERGGPGGDGDGLDRLGPVQVSIRFAHRREVFNDEVGDALRVGHGFAAGDETEVELIEIALHGHV